MNPLTLLDIGQLIGPDGKFMNDVVDTMYTSGDFTEDGIWTESNAFGKNITPRWESEVSGEARIANRGIPTSKGSIGHVADYVGFFESASIVDDFSLRNVPQGNKQAFRMEYDIAHSRGLAKTMRTNSFYGDRGTDGNQPNGLSTRRSTLGDYCFDAGGAGSKNTSLYIGGWDLRAGIHHIFPEGSIAGINYQDFGLHVIVDPDNTDVSRLLPLWISWFYMDFGIVVRDEKALFRIANIDPDSTTDAHYQTVYKLLNKAMREMNLEKSKLRIYGNTDALAFVDNMNIHIPNMNIKPVEIQGKTYWDSFNGAPLRECNEITSAEATVS